MQFTSKTLILLLAATCSTQAFTVNSRQHASIRQGATAMKMAGNEKVEALRATAAKARADADRLRKELGESFPTTVAAPVIPKKSADEVKSIVPTLLSETDLEKQSAGWQDLKESKSVEAFGSANLKSFPVALQMLEQRTGLTPESLGINENIVDLEDFKYATLWVTGGCSVLGIASLAFLPENVGASLCYFFALIPIVFLAIGSSVPAIIANGIAFLRGGNKEGADGVSMQERVCRHEAAHFCCGYWCGLPVAGYSVEENVARVEFAVSNSQYTSTEVAALSVTALAGVVAEAKKWDNVVPGTGTGDLLALDGVFRQSSDFLGSAAQQDLTRWGAMTATLLLKKNEAAYENVVKAFERQAPLEECVALLEE